MTTAPSPVSPPPLKADSYWSRLALHRVPSQYVLFSAFVSYLILAVGYLEGVTPWLAFGLALAPWSLIVFFELEWSYQHFGWFALFGFVAFVQTIHYSEHCIQVIQVHFFDTPLHDSQAIFGALQREWVHFIGDTLLTVGTLILLYRFPRNPWLWVAVPFQILHQAEHTFLIWTYQVNHYPAGGPGLFSSPGGAVFGGVGLNRPDLHWIYNTLYTVPFAIALIWQLKRTYDESLDEAFPEVPKQELVEASKHLETFHYMASETVLAPGDEADRMYIIVEGEAGIYQHDSNRRLVEVDVLHHGQYFGEAGLLLPDAERTRTIRAKTDLTVLAMDEPTFRHLLAASHATEEHVAAMARTEVTPSHPAPEPTTVAAKPRKATAARKRAATGSPASGARASATGKPTSKAAPARKATNPRAKTTRAEGDEHTGEEHPRGLVTPATPGADGGSR